MVKVIKTSIHFSSNKIIVNPVTVAQMAARLLHDRKIMGLNLIGSYEIVTQYIWLFQFSEGALKYGKEELNASLKGSSKHT